MIIKSNEFKKLIVVIAIFFSGEKKLKRTSTSGFLKTVNLKLNFSILELLLSATCCFYNTILSLCNKYVYL